METWKKPQTNRFSFGVLFQFLGKPFLANFWCVALKGCWTWEVSRLKGTSAFAPYCLVPQGIEEGRVSLMYFKSYNGTQGTASFCTCFEKLTSWVHCRLKVHYKIKIRRKFCPTTEIARCFRQKYPDFAATNPTYPLPADCGFALPVRITLSRIMLSPVTFELRLRRSHHLIRKPAANALSAFFLHH